MKISAQKFPLILAAVTVANFGMLAYSLFAPRTVDAQSVAPVLRGKALQIVDDAGKVRASIGIFPADPKVKLPDGSTLKETVLLRLIDPNGRPNVKIETTEQGGGLLLAGPTDPGWLQLFAKDGKPLVKLTGRDGKVNEMKP